MDTNLRSIVNHKIVWTLSAWLIEVNDRYVMDLKTDGLVQDVGI